MAEYCNDNFLMVEDNDNSFRMWQGLVGPHYTPILSNDGTLRWTNDGFLQNPDEVNIRGPQGAGLSIGGIRETEGELPATAPPGAIWLVGTEVPYEGYSYIGGEWVDLGPLSVGPAGPPGPQGDDYTLTEADKAEIADAAEVALLNNLANNPLPLSRGGTGSQTLAGAQERLGITDLADQIGDTPLATEAQDIRGAINELVGDLGSLDFDTEAQNVTGAVNELAEDKVSKSGDTMTGNLLISNAELQIETLDAEIDTPPSNTITRPIFYIKDKNGVNVGWIRGLFRSNGRTGIQFGAARGIYTNAVALDIDESGNYYVTFGASRAWRNGLGLGTDGILPITVDQGGTGQSDATSTSTISDIAVSAASNTTITGASYAQWGKLAMVHLVFTRTVNTGTNTNVTLATMVSGKHPKITSMAVVQYTGANVIGFIEDSGSVKINTPTSIPLGTEIVIDAIYILA